MASGFSMTGEIDGTEEADPTRRRGMAATLLPAVEQWTVSPAVLQTGRHQRGFVPTLASGAEGLR